MSKSFTLHNFPKEERPREKIISAGPYKLTDKELLVALLGRGINGESVMVTAERLLGRFRNIRRIAGASILELSKVRGIGEAKAAQIKAAFELGRRLNGGIKGAEPFVKWAGGKSQLLDQYSAFFPQKYNRYFEPFLGGGAIFFHLKPKRAMLSDLNQDLIHCYSTIKKEVQVLIKVLEKYQTQHDKEFFYKVREDYNSQALRGVERAAAFIYLNKSGFNGLYRVNSSGGFNVPFGEYKTMSVFDPDNLLAVNKLLKGTDLRVCSFEKIVDYAKPGDFIYLDPPYYPLNRTSNFTSYTKNDFLENEQKRLAATFKEFDEKGCLVMLSNSDTKFIKDLYKNFRIEKVKANRFINSNSEKRGAITELVILNY